MFAALKLQTRWFVCVVLAWALLAFSSIFGIGLLWATPAAAATVSVSNGYQYVSDGGQAKFTLKYSAPTGATVYYWTGPGKVSIPLDSQSDDRNIERAQSTGSGNSTKSLNAYGDITGAENATTKIGVWTVPAGAVKSSDVLTLTLDSQYRNFAGYIRPLKITVSSGGSNDTGTYYPVTLTQSQNVSQRITSRTGTIRPVYTSGTCMGSSAETGVTLCKQSLSLTNGTETISDENTKKTLDMTGIVDGVKKVIGTWAITESTGFSYDITAAGDLTEIDPISFTISDIRGSGWSGWWDQSLNSSANHLAGVSTYNTSQVSLTPPAWFFTSYPIYGDTKPTQSVPAALPPDDTVLNMVRSEIELPAVDVQQDPSTVALKLGLQWVNTWVYAALYSTPNSLGWFNVGSDGTVLVPVKGISGLHTLALFDENGSAIAMTQVLLFPTAPGGVTTGASAEKVTTTGTPSDTSATSAAEVPSQRTKAQTLPRTGLSFQVTLLGIGLAFLLSGVSTCLIRKQL